MSIAVSIMDRTQQFYSHPSYVGGSFPVYSGSRRQRGGSIFGSALRQVLPDGATVGRQVMGYVGDVANDMMQGKNLGDALKQRAKERAGDILRQGVKKISSMAGKAIASKLGQKRQAPPLRHPAPKRMRPAAPRRPPPRRRRVSMQKFRPKFRHRRRGFF